jgi:hypothetical protein
MVKLIGRIAWAYLVRPGLLIAAFAFVGIAFWISTWNVYQSEDPQYQEGFFYSSLVPGLIHSRWNGLQLYLLGLMLFFSRVAGYLKDHLMNSRAVVTPRYRTPHLLTAGLLLFVAIVPTAYLVFYRLGLAYFGGFAFARVARHLSSIMRPIALARTKAGPAKRL